MQNSVKQPHWDAELYKKNSIKLQQTSAIELIDKLEFKPNCKILDVGCGDGKITVRIAEKFPGSVIIGTDLSEDMITLAKQDHAGIDSVQFLVQNAEKSLYKKTFDWVFSFFCLQWVINKQDALNNIANALKPNGQIALIMTDRNQYLLRSRNKIISEKKWKPYFINYEDITTVIDNDDYENYAHNAGLDSLVYTEKVKDIFFKNQKELFTFISMITPAKKYLPIGLQESFIKTLTKEYINEIPEKLGSKWYISYTLKTLRGTKMG
ncbi:MAG: class I SAM-dependent methyltransferase [Legionella sp.]|nr:class I SAM-dependent methyltransferase [Legionella sp.]